MKAPRLRPVLKWAGLSLCALIFAAWLASRWYSGMVTCATARAFRGMSLGRTGMSWYSMGDLIEPESRGWSARLGRHMQSPWEWNWRPEWHQAPSYLYIKVPLPVPFFFSAVLTALCFLPERRETRWARQGRCPACGYDRASLPRGARCPECGTPAPSSPAPGAPSACPESGTERPA